MDSASWSSITNRGLIMAFNAGIPLPGDLLSQSQQDLLANNGSLNTTYAIDHVALTSIGATRGFHKDIHIVKRVGNAAAVSGTYTVFSKDYTTDSTTPATDTQLFGITGLGGVSQLTGNASQQEGWCWCGGILLQWGRVNSTTNGTVTFKGRSATTNTIPFPTNCFSVQTIGIFTGANPNGAAGIAVNMSTLSRLKFDWVFNSNSGAYSGFLWFAVGN